MFVIFEINCLLDTGSTSTIMHPKKFMSIPETVRPTVTEVSGGLRMANGNIVNASGTVTLPFEIQGQTFRQRVIIADVEAPVVLGYDFLLQHQCTIDIGRTELKIGDLTIKCTLESQLPSIFRITVAENVLVPPTSEMVVPCKVDGGAPHFSNAILEAANSKLADRGIFVAKSLVDPCTGNVPLRLINISSEPQQLYKHTHAATCQPVQVVEGEIDHTEPPTVSGKVNKVSHDTDGNTAPLPEHLFGLFDSFKGKLTPEQELRAKELLQKHKKVFSSSKFDLGASDIVEHRIHTGEATPIKQAPRRVPLTMKGEVDKEIKQLLDHGLIEKSKSSWSSPIVLVRKPDNSLRVCVDYRKLNSVTIRDSYPLPDINTSLDSLQGSKWFSTLDLTSGYYQVKLHPEDADKSAFVCHSGLFQFRVLSLGLCNAPATFQRLMEFILAGLQWGTCLIYLDDIIVFSKDFDSHLARLDEILTRIADANLKISAKKCSLFRNQVKFLGHVVSDEGVATDLDKVKAILSWPTPKNVTELRSFVGTASYYRRFIKNFAQVAKPLHKLMEKSASYNWSAECQDSFQELKQALTVSPVLGYPSTEPGDAFILDTDACDYGIGAVLSQIQRGQERVIAYFSKSLGRSERQYCITRKELLAIVASVKHFHHYLYGVHFTVRTDHGALTWLTRFKHPEGQMARWLEVLSSYDFKIQHRAGLQHRNADGLSRRPCSPCRHCERQEEKEFGPAADQNPKSECCRVMTRSRKPVVLSGTGKLNADGSTVQGTDKLNDIDERNKNSPESSHRQEVSDGVCKFNPLGLGICSTDNGVDTDSRILAESSSPSDRDSHPVATDVSPFRNDSESSVSKECQSWLTTTRPTLGASPDWLTLECREQLKEGQVSDPILSIVYTWMSNNKRPTWEEISHLGAVEKAYWSQWDCMRLEDGVIYRELFSPTKENSRQLLVPQCFRNGVLKMMHNDVTAGHLGITRTLARLQSRFYWVNYKTDVTRWCNNCTVCQARKGPTEKAKAAMKQYNVGVPLERVAIDISGPFPETPRGNKYVLGITDQFTKWVELCPMPDQEAVTVARLFMTEFITRFGVPRQIISDQGKQFESALFQELCRLLDIDKTRASASHPQSNGVN